MEKLEVGQVWKSVMGIRGRKILRITGPEKYADIKYRNIDDGRINLIFASNFQRWIARTGAKLEGRDA